MRLNRILLEKLTRVLWAAVLVTLPVTSFRYFPFMGEGTMVRPLALYPLILLATLMFIRLLRKEITLPLPGSLVPLAGFVLIALTTTVIGALFTPVDLHGQAYGGRAVRAWVTMILGLAFFLTAIWMNRNQDDLHHSLKWLYIGLVLNIFWGGIQVLTFQTDLLDKHLVTLWQRAFSMRELVRTNRVSGLAYEPAWLAGQIATLYLPWLFAALMMRYRVSRFKWLEPLLLISTILLLLMTYSRGGVLIAVVAAALTFTLTGRALFSQVWYWFTSGFRAAQLPPWVKFRTWVIRLGSVLLLVIILIGVFLLLSQKNYFSRLWTSSAESLEEYLIENYAGSRIAYAWGAMQEFQDHPWTGVGLGASGFYIYQNLPDWALTTVPEIARQLSPTTGLYPNPKNLFIRLLTETGLPGFILFMAFQFSVLANIHIAWHMRTMVIRFLGIAGLFSWLAIMLYCFTQDSFAFPNLWINLGLITGLLNSLNHPSTQLGLQYATEVEV
jgi:O-antigen ligase